MVPFWKQLPHLTRLYNLEAILALGYRECRNFLSVVAKEQEACKTSGREVQDHFVEMHEMVDLGFGAKRKIEDLALLRALKRQVSNCFQKGNS